MKRLEEEIKFNSFMVPEKLPEELQGGRHTVQYLQEVASEPAMGQAGLQELEDKVRNRMWRHVRLLSCVGKVLVMFNLDTEMNRYNQTN